MKTASSHCITLTCPHCGATLTEWSLDKGDPSTVNPWRCGACQKSVEITFAHVVTCARSGFEPTPFFDRLREIFQSVLFKRVENCWSFADRDERQQRMALILDLAAELAAIKKISPFATRLGESVIEEIIQGDWDAALRFAEMFTFEDEQPYLRDRYAPLWERFVQRVRTARAEYERGSRAPS